MPGLKGSFIKNTHQLTRRDFIKAGGAALASAFFFNSLAGCSPKTETVTKTATATATRTLTKTSIITVSPTPATRVVTDMAGREVTLSGTISRIATVGAVGVLNGFVFAMGQASKVVTGLPERFDVPSWKYQYVVAPNIKGLPKIQLADGSPNIEELLKLAPDVVFTMNMPQVTTMENAGLNVIYLSWTQPEDVKQAMTLLGEIFDEQQRAADYIKYFDDTLIRVKNITDNIPSAEKTSVLYGSLSGMSNPHIISEWWISAAGGLSATGEIHTSTESVEFHVEDLLQWNPQVIFLSSPADMDTVYTDTRFASISAIQNERVYITPKGVHIWGNRNIEQPLTVLWAGSRLYPEAFKDINIYSEVKNFYATFFDTVITDAQVDEILGGNITSF